MGLTSTLRYGEFTVIVNFLQVIILAVNMTPRLMTVHHQNMMTENSSCIHGLSVDMIRITW